MNEARRLEWDWYAGTVPENVELDDTAYVETTYSFTLYRSRVAAGLRVGRGASVYLGTMFDVGPRGRVSVGEFALVHGARIICDSEVEIGDHTLISWNVVLMDSYRIPFDPGERRDALQGAARDGDRQVAAGAPARRIRIGANVWIGFDACILPGVTVGEGSIIGARSVVVNDVPPRTVVGGNPARVLRCLAPEELPNGQ
jgi:acetyltransferase-like isoleucine patch superfamily enzyme